MQKSQGCNSPRGFPGWTRARGVLRASLAIGILFGLWAPPRAHAGSLQTFTLPGPGANGGLYLPDLQASFPAVDWQTLDRLYLPAGHYRFINLGNLPVRSPARPLVITNQGGQVRVGGLSFHYNFIVSGGSHWTLTGAWEPGSATGHPDFPGHRGGAYRQSRGRYGILIDDVFEDTGNSGLAVGGGATHFEISFLEITRVGFAGALIKTDNDGGAEMVGVEFHDNYIHDTGSEGVYFGSTQAQPQHKITDLRFYNNRLIRTGTEALQLGQLGGGSEIHHNVFLFGALDWKDPFQGFQDNHSQIAAREGSVSVHHNICIGGASTFLISFSQDVTGDTHDLSDLVHYRGNYFSHSRNIGAYIHSSANSVTRFRFEGNVFRAVDFQYDELNSTSVNHNRIFRIFNTANPIELLNNRWQGPQVFAAVAGSNVTELGNVQEALPPIAFVDSGFPPDFDYLLLEIWADTSSLTGEPVVYQQGDFVVHEGLLYHCIEPGTHTGKTPPDHPATWEARALPVDDVRLSADSPYAGFGLLDTVHVFADDLESGNLGHWSLVTP